MRDLFVRELRGMLGIEQRLLDEVLPALRERAQAVDLQVALDRHILETDGHVTNLRRVFTLIGEPDVPLAAAPPEASSDGDLGMLASILRTEAFEVATYEFLVHTARELDVDGEAVRLLRLNLEQDAYAYEQAEHALAKLLAEATASR